VSIEAASLPKVSLSWAHRIRLAVVGVLVVLALLRVVPDFVRVIYPRHVFGYRTDGNGIVTFVAARPSPRAAGALARLPAGRSLRRRSRRPVPRCRDHRPDGEHLSGSRFFASSGLNGAKKAPTTPLSPLNAVYGAGVDS